MKSIFKRVGALMLAGAAFAACSDGDGVSPTSPEFGGFDVHGGDGAAVVNVEVCKVFTEEGAEGDYDFDYEITPNGGGAATGSGSLTLTAGDGTGPSVQQGCDDAGASTTIPVDRGSTLTVTELAVGEGTAALDMDVPVGLLPFQECEVNEEVGTIRTTGSVSVTFDDATCHLDSYRLFFKNISFDPPEEGGQGCTPGYWRQAHHYGNWIDRSPGDDFDTEFGVDWFDPDVDLGTAVQLKGGGINALARHAVAALLNAEQGFYPLTVAEVIAAVQNVDTSDAGEVESLKNQFDEDNNLGCDLGRAEGDEDVAGEDLGDGPGNGKGNGKGNG